MKKLYYTSAVSAILVIIMLASCGKKDNSDGGRESRGQQQVLSHEKDIEASPEQSFSPESPPFLVRLDENTLTLYDLSDTEPAVIKSVNIDISYYPFDDIRELNSGIPAYSKERGYEILENFIN